MDLAEKWYRIDNVAKVFMASRTRRDPRVIRLSCTLTEKVDPALLSQAVKQAAAERPQFQVSLHRGLFWPYLDTCQAEPLVEEETDTPCRAVYEDDSRKLLYRVSYYNCRISLEVFHVLTDGTGGLDYLQLIVRNYLAAKNPKLKDLPPMSASEADRELDGFRNFFDNKASIPESGKTAFQLRGGKLPYNQTSYFEAHLPVKKLLKLSKETGVSLTSYLTGLLTLSIFREMPARERKKPITIGLPVNLRNYYPSATSRNFFNSIMLSQVLTGEETLEQVARAMDEQIKEKTKPENIRIRMDSFQKLEEFKIASLVPLPVKNLVVRLFTWADKRKVTATISSMGILKVADPLKKYIRGFEALSSTDSLFLTVLTYQDDLVLGISSAYRSTNVLRNFFQYLTAQGVDVRLYATEVIS